ncbi:MAG: epoxyqueuosine reductase [Ruminococcaceae bacterium]|nr:epoxyqueuosine reductase [Oscillospiraceae bacterium]
MENGGFVNSFNEIISQKLKSLGINEFGFASIEKIDSSRAKTLPNAVSIVVPLSDYIVDEIDKEPTFAYFQHYRAVNAYIDSVLLQLGIFIQENGYKYMPIAASQSIPSNDTPYSAYISHKAAARAAGLGTIGKNALFLSKRYGARVRLGTLLTDMPFDTACITEFTDVCGACNMCKRSCPAMAITGNLYKEGAPRESIIDAAACSSYMKKQYQHIGRGVVCGICMRVCPYKGEGK